MKILQIVYPGLGGTGSVSFSLIEGQTKKQYKNHFLFIGIEKDENIFNIAFNRLNI